MSVYGGYFYNSSKAKGDQNGDFGPAGNNWNAEARATTSTLGASIGYRSESKTLVFLAASYADQQITGSITHELSNDGLNPASSYALPTVLGSSTAWAAGIRVGEAVMLQADARVLSRSWPHYAINARGGGSQQEVQAGVSLNLRQ